MGSAPMKLRVVRRYVTAGIAAGLMLTAGPRADAQRLPEAVVPVRYVVQWTPDLKRETFTGRVSIDVEVRAATATIVLNAVDLTIIDATVAQAQEQPARATLDQGSQQLTLSLGEALQPGKGQIAISFEGELNKQLAGLYVGKTDKRNYAATQFEPTDARRAFPCFDEPALKATYEISAVVDEGDIAISNSPQIADVPGPAPGKHTVTFAPTPRMSVVPGCAARRGLQMHRRGGRGHADSRLRALRGRSRRGASR